MGKEMRLEVVGLGWGRMHGVVWKFNIAFCAWLNHKNILEYIFCKKHAYFET